jgi:hypothetical protein
MGSPSNNKTDQEPRGRITIGEWEGRARRDFLYFSKKSVLRIWDPGSSAGCPLDPGWKKSESGVNIPDHISENLVTIF